MIELKHLEQYQRRQGEMVVAADPDLAAAYYAYAVDLYKLQDQIRSRKELGSFDIEPCSTSTQAIMASGSLTRNPFSHARK